MSQTPDRSSLHAATRPARGWRRLALLAAIALPLAPLAAAQTVVQRQQVGVPPVPGATAVFGWAESALPDVFPGPQADISLPGLSYRYYPSTGNFVAAAGSDVYVWGPATGNAPQPVRVGTLGDFACAVTPAPCAVKSVHRVTVAGLQREFIVYQPYLAGAAGAAPVVMMLHGSTGTGEEFYVRSGWREKADSTGLVAVFPSALSHCHYEDDNGNRIFEPSERKVVTKWAAGRLGDPARMPLCTAAEIAQLPADRRLQADHPLADDVAFIQQIVDVLRAEYPVDAKRLYVTGFSNGAEMASRLALQASTTFAAVAAAAGGLSVPPQPAARAMSMVQSIGELDPGFVETLGYATRIPLDGSLLANPVFQAGSVVPFTTVLRLDPTLASASSPRVQGVRTNQFVWSTSTSGQRNSFRVVVIAGAEHQYPNGTNHPLRMADILWDFFKDQRLP